MSAQTSEEMERGKISTSTVMSPPGSIAPSRSRICRVPTSYSSRKSSLTSLRWGCCSHCACASSHHRVQLRHHLEYVFVADVLSAALVFLFDVPGGRLRRAFPSSLHTPFALTIPIRHASSQCFPSTHAVPLVLRLLPSRLSVLHDSDAFRQCLVTMVSPAFPRKNLASFDPPAHESFCCAHARVDACR